MQYLHYEKPGKYGDEKTEKYHVKISESSEKSGLTGEIKSVFENLNPGDYVLLSWNHDYVNRNECHSPERPITELKKVTEDEATKMWYDIRYDFLDVIESDSNFRMTE